MSLSNINLATICFEDTLSMFGPGIIISGGDENGSFENSTSFAAQTMKLDIGYEISVPSSSVNVDSTLAFVSLAVRGWVLPTENENKDNPWGSQNLVGWLRGEGTGGANLSCVRAGFPHIGTGSKLQGVAAVLFAANPRVWLQGEPTPRQEAERLRDAIVALREAEDVDEPLACRIREKGRLDVRLLPPPPPPPSSPPPPLRRAVVRRARATRREPTENRPKS
jgi:hypothetical protein